MPQTESELCALCAAECPYRKCGVEQCGFKQIRKAVEGKDAEFAEALAKSEGVKPPAAPPVATPAK